MYIIIYLYMHNSYIIMMERPLTCKLVTVSIAQTGCAAAQSHCLTLAADALSVLVKSYSCWMCICMHIHL